MMQRNSSSLVLPASDSLDRPSNLVTLDINTISSNLIYVTTVLNHEFIKKKIKEVNLQSLMLE